METERHLEEAFAGESQANRKYAIFSERAEEEGFKTVAKLFRAASQAEAIHAVRLLKAMNAIGTTAENLEKGIGGETLEFSAMYPGFVERAKVEGRNDAAIIFTHAMRAEEVHAKIYEIALEGIKKGRDLEAKKILLCPVCGNIALDTPPERCPICGVPGNRFKEVE